MTTIRKVFFQLNQRIVIWRNVAKIKSTVKNPIKLVKKVREYQSHHETVRGNIEESSW